MADDHVTDRARCDVTIERLDRAAQLARGLGRRAQAVRRWWSEHRTARPLLANPTAHDVLEDLLAERLGRGRPGQSTAVVDAEDGFEQRNLGRKVFAQMVSRIVNVEDDVALRLKPSDFGVAFVCAIGGVSHCSLSYSDW